MYQRPALAFLHVAIGLFATAALPLLLSSATRGQTTTIHFDNGAVGFSESFGGSLPSLINWNTNQLFDGKGLIAEFGTKDNPLEAHVGQIVGDKNTVIVEPITYPNGDPLFDGVTQDTRSGLRLDAEFYGRAGIEAGLELGLGAVNGQLDFHTGPSLVMTDKIYAGRFFRMEDKNPGISGDSFLNVDAPSLDLTMNLILDIDARGTLQVGLYPFAPYRIGGFHLPNIPDLDLCGALTTDSGVSVCGGDFEDDAKSFPITLPKPKVPEGAPPPPEIQVGELQLVNPAKALVATTNIDTERNILTTSGETDLVRLAADIDGIIGGFTVGTSELTGGSRKIPNNDKYIAQLKYDLVDVKYGPELGYSYDATIDTNLDVTLGFNSSVLIKRPNGSVTEEISWSGRWEDLSTLAIALPNANAVDVDVDFTGLDTDVLYESRFTIADYMELTALQLELKLNFERLGLGFAATQALKKTLKLPSLGPLYYGISDWYG